MEHIALSFVLAGLREHVRLTGRETLESRIDCLERGKLRLTEPPVYVRSSQKRKAVNRKS
jgi:hypothetical protein